MANDGTLKFDTAIDSSGFQKGISSIGSIAQKGLQATGAILTGATTAIVGIGAAAIKVGSDFESAMSKVAAISGATGSDLDALNEKAKEMGATTKFSATESANAFEYMAMAGWKTEDMLNGIEGIMNLAAASGEDLATTSDIVTDALTAFGLSAQDSTHFADVLAQASSNANTNVGLMGETFKYVAPVAGALGFSAEDTATAIGLMANAGIKGSQAGTALRSVFTRLAKPTKEVQTAMDALGISLTDSQGNVKSLNELMKDLRGGFSNLTDAEQAEMAAMLGGQEAMSGLLAIVNASDEDFEKLTNSIYTCDGAAQEMAATMNDNLQGQLTILKSGLEGLGISLYENMQEPLKNVAKTAQEMVGQLQEAFNSGGLDGLVSAFGDVLANIATKATESAPALIDMAVSLVSSFKESLLSNGQQLAEAGATLIGSLITGIGSAAEDIWVTVFAMAGRIADALLESAPDIISAVIGNITNIIETIRDYFPEFIQLAATVLTSIAQGIAENAEFIVSAVASVLGDLVNAVAGMLPEIAEAGINIIIGIAQGILDNLDYLIDAVLNLVQSIVDTLIKAMPLLLDGAVQLFMGIVKALPKVIKQVVGALPQLITSIVEFLVNSLPEIIDAAIQMLYGLIEAIPDIIAAIVDNLPQIIEAIVDGLIQAVPAIIQGAFQLLMGIVKAIPKLIVALVEALPQIIVALVNGLIALASGLLEVGAEFGSQIGEGLKGAWTAISSWFGEAVSGIADAISTKWEQVKTFFTEIGTAIIEFFSGVPDKIGNVVDTIVTWFSELPGRISEWLTTTIQNIIAWGAELWVSATTAAQNFLDGVISFISGLPNQIAYWLGYAIGTVVKWGVDLWTWATTEIPKFVQGIVDFIAELPGKIWTWLVDAVNKVVQWGINLKNTADTWVTNTINSVVQFFSELPGKIWTWLTDTITKATQWGANLLSTMSTAATNAINNVVNWFSQLPGKVWNWLVSVVTKVTQWAANLLSAASTAAQNAINKVTEWFSQLPGKVWTWLTNTISKVTQFAADLASKASSAAQGFVNNIINGLKGLPDQVKSIGSNIVSGIWNGISSGWDWLVGKVKGLANSLFEGAKDALGISSPSRVFALEVGRWIPPGIGKGVDMTMPDLEDQVDDEVGGLARKMQAAVDLETGNVTVRSKIKAEHTADTEYPKGGDTYYEETIEQHNEYHVPVVTPSETARANREAARRLLGGVK